MAILIIFNFRSSIIISFISFKESRRFSVCLKMSVKSSVLVGKLTYKFLKFSTYFPVTFNFYSKNGINRKISVFDLILLFVTSSTILYLITSIDELLTFKISIAKTVLMKSFNALVRYFSYLQVVTRILNMFQSGTMKRIFVNLQKCDKMVKILTLSSLYQL